MQISESHKIASLLRHNDEIVREREETERAENQTCLVCYRQPRVPLFQGKPCTDSWEISQTC